jgi:hypothetical protein
MRRSAAVIVGALAFAYGASLRATTTPKGTLPTPRVKVENVRLEAPPHGEASLLALLKFEVSNGGATPLTDLVLEISIAQEPGPTELVGRELVRPFKVRGHVVLQPGYAIDYEILLRNLSSDCDCVASVDVVSVQWLTK